MKSFEHLTTLLESRSEDHWQDSITQLGVDYGFEQILIAVVSNKNTSLDQALLRSNYSSKWRNIYDNTQLVNIDPTVSHCMTRSTPLVWEPRIFSSKSQKEMYEEATFHGLQSGITLPFHGANGEIGILSFASDIKPNKDFQKHILHNMPALSLIRDFAFQGSLQFLLARSNELPPILTNREKQCLQWCAHGKGSWEIAKILKCSEATINFHFGNIRRKFNTSSRQQAVLKAIHHGILQSN